MSNQNYEIVKNAEGRYDLIVNGQFVKSYSRKADAERGYLRSNCIFHPVGQKYQNANQAVWIPFSVVPFSAK